MLVSNLNWPNNRLLTDRPQDIGDFRLTFRTGGLRHNADLVMNEAEAAEHVSNCLRIFASRRSLSAMTGMGDETGLGFMIDPLVRSTD